MECNTGVAQFLAIRRNIQYERAVSDRSIACDLFCNAFIAAHEVRTKRLVSFKRMQPIRVTTQSRLLSHFRELAMPGRVGSFHGELMSDLALAIFRKSLEGN